MSHAQVICIFHLEFVMLSLLSVPLAWQMCVCAKIASTEDLCNSIKTKFNPIPFHAIGEKPTPFDYIYTMCTCVHLFDRHLAELMHFTMLNSFLCIKEATNGRHICKIRFTASKYTIFEMKR